MDAKAYLMGQGWSGPGNPLNPSRRPGGPHGGLGLSKPILVSKKRNTFGLGKKATHDHTNQWWLRGFEEALKGIGTEESATPTESEGTASNDSTKPRSELYKYFVKGEGLPGTIDCDVERKDAAGVDIVAAGCEITAPKEKKRKRDEKTSNSEEMANTGKTKKRKISSGSNSTDETVTANDSTRSSEVEDTNAKLEKRKKRKEKNERSKNSVEKSSDSGKEASSKAELKKKKRQKHKGKPDEDVSAETSADPADDQRSHSPTASLSEKEERKRRKALKRAGKEALDPKKRDKESRKSKKKKTKNSAEVS
ncbi:hypothetical protein VTO42DRAFT_2990 [Malbranchea cinnamomea]